MDSGLAATGQVERFGVIRTRMLRLFYQIIGWMFLVSGAILFPLPIPLGALFLAIGSVILMGNSTHFAGFLRGIRRKFPRFNHFVSHIIVKMPPSLRTPLSKTDPDYQEPEFHGDEANR